MGSYTPTDLEWVTVKTTLPRQPFEPAATRPSIRTERLLLRPLRESDLEALHELRTQPEVMIHTYRGKVDADLQETRDNLALRLPPNDRTNFDFAICLPETNRLIGIGGSFSRSGSLGWPEIGYMLRKEAWGRGYATEFLRAFLEAWWALPREESEHKVEKSTVDEAEGEVKAERVMGLTVTAHEASQNVMRKSGLQFVKAWEEEDTHEGGGMITLVGYVAKKKPAA
ncbi:putative N-acetyltransferase-like protein [Hapsidospora chrysogenum ATCC 11550]|uniref:Putative N-acetyltransferase-like protein n=1 Tax=Hapsidospora chrysogenum (strain ATCC 11550 / CBS 779.69 / DSM 880 / IAM 14645 / JCM 23072 / IMI 49137) TaxID=857340 RepID=A0A086TAQ1_HAPC1|nr:putative N-acetyltransferase-like protein [Hapsidospora chrysogenum ATCC 11550]